MTTPYEILGVGKDADADAIKQAYRSKAQKLHPDKEGGDEAAFKQVKAAYELLSDPVRRERYDATGLSDMPDIDKEAQSGLGDILVQVVDMVDVDHTDIVAAVLAQVRSHMKDVTIKRNDVDKVIKKRERALRRLKSKGNQDFAQRVLQGSINERKTVWHKLDTAIKILQRMEEMANDYTYSFDVNSWGSRSDDSFFFTLPEFK